LGRQGGKVQKDASPLGGVKKREGPWRSAYIISTAPTPNQKKKKKKKKKKTTPKNKKGRGKKSSGALFNLQALKRKKNHGKFPTAARRERNKQGDLCEKNKKSTKNCWAQEVAFRVTRGTTEERKLNGVSAK